MNVIYFSAPWCGPCKTFKPIVQEVSREMGVAVNDINVDYDASFTEKYNITSIPTILILDHQGVPVFRHTGVMGKDALANVFRQHKH